MSCTILRKRMRSIRKALSPLDVKSRSCSIVERCVQLTQFQEASSVALYASDENEVETFALMTWLIGRGVTVSLPVIQNQNMAFYEFDKNNTVLNRFSITEPDKSVCRKVSFDELDVIVLPLVVFDRLCFRIGRGGGFYDRALERVVGMKSSPFLISLAYAFQEVENCHPQKHDIQMDCIVTENEIFKANG